MHLPLECCVTTESRLAFLLHDVHVLYTDKGKRQKSVAFYPNSIINHGPDSTGAFDSAGKQDIIVFGCLLVNVLRGISKQLGKKE